MVALVVRPEGDLVSVGLGAVSRRLGAGMAAPVEAGEAPVGFGKTRLLSQGGMEELDNLVVLALGLSLPGQRTVF